MIDILWSLTRCPLADNYIDVLKCYEEQAKRFSKKEQRPAVIVIDAIEDLEQTLQVEMIRRAKVHSRSLCRVLSRTLQGSNSPPAIMSRSTRSMSRCLIDVLLDVLLCMQDWADEGIIRVVFVSSPGKFISTIGGEAVGVLQKGAEMAALFHALMIFSALKSVPSS